MSKKVLIINLEFPPVGGPGVQRVLKFVQYLPENGWTPTVICGSKSTWCDRPDNSLLNDIPDDVNVFRLSFNTISDYSDMLSTVTYSILFPFRLLFNKKKILEGVRDTISELSELFYYIHPEPLLSWMYVGTRKAIRLHKKYNFDVVLTSGPPHTTHLVGLMLKRLDQVKWVADFRDPWVDSRLDPDRLGVSRRLDRIWERLVIENADRLVSVSPSWARLFECKLMDCKGSKVHVVYNGYDPDDITDDILKATATESDSHTLRIHYNGTIQGPMLPVLFFKALAKLKKELPGIHTSMRCTFTGLPGSVAKVADDLGLNSLVRDVGRLSHSESLRMSVSSDVLLLILNDIDETVKGQITGKVYEYVATGKNILAIIPLGGDLQSFLKNCIQCYIVGWNDVSGIVEMLKSLMIKKRNGKLESISPPTWIEQYTRQAQTRKLAGILDNLVQ